MPKTPSNPSVIKNTSSSVIVTSNQNRKYPQADVKHLYARSTGLCAFPGCSNECILDKTSVDPHRNVGEIAHIAAHSNGGPRSSPGLSAKERDCYENWVLLCAHHHNMVDVQPNTYTSAELRQWKEAREEWVWKRTREQIPNVGFQELDVVCRSIPTQPPSQGSVWSQTLTPPIEKMRKNNLTEPTEYALMLGLAMAQKVKEFIDRKVRLDYSFPQRLNQGFIDEYNRLWNQGIRGDDLFRRLQEFASDGSYDFTYQAASLGVLSYLFEQCDIFER